MKRRTGRNSIKPTRRGWLLLGSAVFWALFSLLAIFDVIPIRSAIDRAPGVVDAARRSMLAVPYIGRVQESMEVHGHPATEIAAKLQFLTASYLIMLGAYAVLLLGVSLVFVAWGAKDDFYTDMLTVFGKRSVNAYWLAMPIIAVADLFFVWIGLTGYRNLADDHLFRADFIVTSNFWIVDHILPWAASLFISLALVRFTLCYLSALRSAPDIPIEWPHHGVPQVEPAPEVEPWKPENER